MNRRDIGVNGHITCIEPDPIDMIKELDENSENFELIARPIQCVPLKYFTQLQPNDIVFVDSNHAVRSGSEVNYVVLEILPIRRVCWCIFMISIYPMMTETCCGILCTQMKLRLSPLFLRVIRDTRYFSL